MLNNIFVYLFPDTILYLKSNQKLLNCISKDNNVEIKLIEKKFNPHIIISVNFENCHKTRILLQEIEKDNYQKAEKD